MWVAHTKLELKKTSKSTLASKMSSASEIVASFKLFVAESASHSKGDPDPHMPLRLRLPHGLELDEQYAPAAGLPDLPLFGLKKVCSVF